MTPTQSLPAGIVALVDGAPYRVMTATLVEEA